MSQSSAFARSYKQLNLNQKRAVDTTEGVVMVIAGPGTGKTQMLTLRIANILLTSQAEPENILALTYTEAGVSAMKQRLVSIIGPAGYRVGIHTFHGFAHQVLTHYAPFFPELAGFEHVSELEQLEMVEAIITDLPLRLIKPLAQPFAYVKQALQSISKLKKENIAPQVFADILEKQEAAVLQQEDLYHTKGAHKGKMKSRWSKELNSIKRNRELAQVYTVYEETLSTQQRFDYEDMLLKLSNKLEADADFLLELQERYQYILIDEHQDTNAAQNHIVSLLSNFHPNPNLFVVGDEKQAIYRFQGASLTNFLAIKQRYPETHLISLDQNYRSPQTILDASHALIAHNPLPSSIDLPARTRLKAKAQQDVPQSIALFPVVNSAQEYWFVAWHIKKLIDAGVDPGEIAVLNRKNNQVFPLQAPLAFLDIAYVVESKRNLLQDPLVASLLLLLRAVCDVQNDSLITQVLFLAHYKVHPRDIIKLSRFAREHKKPLWDVLDSLEQEEIPLQTKEAIAKVYALVTAWATLAHNQPLDVVFTTILRQSGLLEVIGKTSRYTQGVQNFITLYHEVRVRLSKTPNLTLSDFLAALDGLHKHDVSLASAAAHAPDSAVHLLTAHGAKGKEYEYVFVMGVTDKTWGNSREIAPMFVLPYDYMEGITHQEFTPEDPNADERRLFYVALTRARKQVVLTYSTSTLEGKHLEPSMFIQELEREQDEPQTATLEDFSRWFAQNQVQVLTPVGFVSNRSTALDELRSFVAATFARQSLSVSALNNYLTCPWRYFFRNLVLLPEAKTAPLVFGSAIHQALHVFFSAKGVDKASLAFESFEGYIGRQTLRAQEKNDLIAQAQLYVPPYLKERASTIVPPFMSELSIPRIGLTDTISLSGKLDLVQIVSARNEVRVWDFKTGKPKSRNDIEGKTKTGTGDYKRQLVFYKLLLNEFRGGAYQMIEGVIDFIKPKPSGQFAREVFVITPQEELELKETIYRVAQEITTLSFWNDRCSDSKCEYCALRSLM